MSTERRLIAVSEEEVEVRRLGEEPITVTLTRFEVEALEPSSRVLLWTGSLGWRIHRVSALAKLRAAHAEQVKE